MTAAAAAARRVLVVVALPLALLVLWWVASADSQSFYLPPLSQILEAFASTWLSGRLVDDVLPSVARLLTGFALATVVGVALGVVVGSSRGLRATLEPVLEFLRAIPPPVLVPIFILVAGIGTTMKVLVIVSGCLWPILLNTIEGVRARDEVLEDTCHAYGIRGSARLRHLVLRAASPQIVTGMRQALAIGIILMVISEMFAASSGLGFTIIQFQRGFAIPEMWSGILLLGLLGVVLSLGFRAFENRVLAWYYGLRRAERGRS
jgi:ABC-type nitrate/sulfonate/bicarbonate transport system permease component